jgi:hypothetical protein
LEADMSQVNVISENKSVVFPCCDY